MGKMLIWLLLMVLVSGCGRPARIGHRGAVDAALVTMVVVLDRDFVRAHSDKVLVVGDGPGAEDGKEAAGYGFGHGVWQSSTEVDLVLGSVAGGADLGRATLRWGETTIEAMVLPGQPVYATVVISGGRRGRVDVGAVITAQSEPGDRRCRLIGSQVVIDGD
ncbi:MAG: hypothetical protein ACYTF0_08505 [Planctomycetota bacterium]|jgi:hypothetical protein